MAAAAPVEAFKVNFYVTTPIYYVNAKPHLGHAYTTIVNDVLARFHRLEGYDAYFLTGTDEHGDKIVRAAEKEGRSPREYVDEISALFRAAWPGLSISNDDFIRTTEERHRRVVSRFMDLVNRRGDIYFGEYGGHYCFGCERFYTEKELVGGLCPDHGVKPEYISEKNYFFRMGNYQDWLIEHIRANPGFIRPERYRNEVLGFLREPLEDLCITRPKSRLTWGIDVPFDDNFVTYVWFDALINYISALGWPDGELFGKYWPVAQHTIAKDILKPHAIFWPTMLKSAGQEIYRHLNVHGYWQIGLSKMSKSVGNVVEALSMADRYGTDAFRYFLMREMAFGLDSEFSEDRLVERHNSDLANDLGNLWQRSLAMIQKFSAGRVPVPDGLEPQPDDGEWLGRAVALAASWRQAFGSVNPREALALIWDHVGLLNKTIDSEAPWVLARDPARRGRLEAVLARLAGGLALVSALFWPVMPTTAENMWLRLGLDPGAMTSDPAAIAALLAHGRPLSAGQAFFPRIEVPGAAEGRARPARAAAHGTESPGPAKAAPGAAPAEGLLTIDEFRRVELRVARILAAEAVPKSDKLLRLLVSLGDDGERTILAGIGRHYRPEDLVGRLAVVVANLAPARLMGQESQGMVLAASGDGRLLLVTVAGEMDPGARVS
ncbi:MAG: methionine--tRNA ligase [Deltaproteobacteria bacterium]|jgi:methionyl-tRNA synthetase|nr:methionine--tRNA ligase [Deltaproteobacteria bacterium]